MTYISLLARAGEVDETIAGAQPYLWRGFTFGTPFPECDSSGQACTGTCMTGGEWNWFVIPITNDDPEADFQGLADRLGSGLFGAKVVTS